MLNDNRDLEAAKKQITQQFVTIYQPTNNNTDNSNNVTVGGNAVNSNVGSMQSTISQDAAQVANGSNSSFRNQTIGDRTINCFTQSCQHMSQCCGDVSIEIRKCLGLI